MKWLLTLLLLIMAPLLTAREPILTGAEQPERYLPLLAGKKVGLLVNQTSRVGEQHLVDFLLQQQVQVVGIFAPEHGFRGDADAGAKIDDSRDTRTGLPIWSMYGASKKPDLSLLQQLDVVIFDIQDVGVRYYTYISSMHYMMEAAAAAGVAMLVLDRPNPNGAYLDGPVLELKFPYELPIPPSPNLPNSQAIKLYPSLGFFEATPMSVGRGTPFPFQVLGYDQFATDEFSFIPVSTPGAALNPPLKDKQLYGEDLRQVATDGLTLAYLMRWQQLFASHAKVLFTAADFMDKLAGTDKLRLQIERGDSEQQIRDSWQGALQRFKQQRQPYLLYPE
ncbi:MAG: hypothetical protein B7X50_14285 [Alishewanella sp. 34-51-39]|nr:MAG: hypothetical protein B7X50_14285 [Alishewanella sp. 34-51-39]